MRVPLFEKVLKSVDLLECYIFLNQEGSMSPPQFWSQFQERCAMRWNEWKNNFPILFFWVIVKFHRKLTVFRTKMTRTLKMKIGKIWNLIFLSIQSIPDISCKFDHWRKKYFIFLILMLHAHTEHWNDFLINFF